MTPTFDILHRSIGRWRYPTIVLVQVFDIRAAVVCVIERVHDGEPLEHYFLYFVNTINFIFYFIFVYFSSFIIDLVDKNYIIFKKAVSIICISCGTHKKTRTLINNSTICNTRLTRDTFATDLHATTTGDDYIIIIIVNTRSMIFLWPRLRKEEKN